MHSHSRAFTLVEVLVVLAVTVVLAAILLSVFARVREHGRQTACESNLHQIGLALQQYTSDNNGLYPHIPGDWPGKPKWSAVIQPYLKSSQVFDCPSHAEHYPVPPPGGYPADYPYSGDYRYNFWGIRNPDKSISEAQSETLVPDPEHTSLVGDAGWFELDDATQSLIALHYMQEVGGGDSKPASYFYSVHSGGANFVFADGHVKWLSTQQQARTPWKVGSFSKFLD